METFYAFFTKLFCNELDWDSSNHTLSMITGILPKKFEIT